MNRIVNIFTDELILPSGTLTSEVISIVTHESLFSLSIGFRGQIKIEQLSGPTAYNTTFINGDFDESEYEIEDDVTNTQYEEYIIPLTIPHQPESIKIKITNLSSTLDAVIDAKLFLGE